MEYLSYLIVAKCLPAYFSSLKSIRLVSGRQPPAPCQSIIHQAIVFSTPRMSKALQALL